MGKTKIEWTDDSWNPVRGCARISPGCEHCYAEAIAERFSGPGQAFEGFAVRGKGWTRRFKLLVDRLAEPLSWRAPRKVFVNSTSDLFGEGLTFEEIAAVFGVMAQTPRHTYQVLTKRAERMGEFFRWVSGDGDEHAPPPDHVVTTCAVNLIGDMDQLAVPWPLPNVWIGVSIEDQQRAEERLPWLLEVPAAVRFISAEPLLGPVDLENVVPYFLRKDRNPNDPILLWDVLRGHVKGPDEMRDERIGWVIVGGESGPGARPFDVAWARSLVRQCRAARVPCFVKQLGDRATDAERTDLRRVPGGFTNVPHLLQLRTKKGGNMAEWPEDLRVRQFPRAAEA